MFYYVHNTYAERINILFISEIIQNIVHLL